MLLLVQNNDKLISCSHFNKCGGCKTQFLAYEEQLAQKQKVIEELFDFPVRKIIPSGLTWRYRNKMEFSFSQSKDGKKFLGLFMQKGRGKVIDLEECYLCSSWMVEALKAVKSWWENSTVDAFHPPLGKGTLRTLVFREGIQTGERMAVLTQSGSPSQPLSENQLYSFEKTLLSVTRFDSIIVRTQNAQKGMPTFFQQQLLYGKKTITEMLYDAFGEKKYFHIGATSFFQPNTLQAQTLYQRALLLAGLSKEDILYDWYCGTGTIGILAASMVKKVYGIEINEEAVLDAQLNAKLNNINNLTVQPCDAGKIEFFWEKPTVVIVDPPREGLSKASFEYLASLRAKKIISISCNPVSQKENTQWFIEAGYRICSIQPVDQFPQTSHIENIIALAL